MAILSVHEVGKLFGGARLFAGISFLLNEGERLALVGPNGAGKTTLLRGIAGLAELEEGRVSLAPGARVGYLSQDPDLDPDLDVAQEAARAFQHLRRWEERLRDMEARMAATPPGPALDELMEAYGRLSHRFEAAGGYEADARVRMVLFGVGFRDDQLGLPTRHLSGGQKVRLGLAKLLLGAPELMLLDEPTNHLDLAAVEWLEGYLKQIRASAVIVSHDRYFLDAVTQRTLELAGGKATLYHGNYSYYLTAREERLQQLAEAWQTAREEAERLKAYIRKYGAGNRATQAHDRERKLERLEEQMAQMERPAGQRALRLKFEQDYATGEDLLKVTGLAKAYGNQIVFSGLDLQVDRGERVALVGPNGAGKTTFLKVIHGLVPPTAGRHWWGVGVRRAYFSQDLDQLDGTGTVQDEILSLPGMTIFAARSLLARFLFRGEAVEKPVSALSGGERNRLTLARMVLSGANVLLMDEPTNHLDLEAKQVLEDALLSFPGTLFFISHDRWFVDRLATRVLEFRDRRVTAYPGNYTAYRAARELEAAAAQASTPAAAPAPQGAPAGGEGAGRGRPPRPGKEERRAQAELRRLEETIQQLEARKEELAALLADPDTYRGPRGREWGAEYQAVERDLERLYVEWEALAGSSS